MLFHRGGPSDFTILNMTTTALQLESSTDLKVNILLLPSQSLDNLSSYQQWSKLWILVQLKAIISHRRHNHSTMALPAHPNAQPMNDGSVCGNRDPTIAEFAKRCIDAFEKSVAMPAIVKDPTLIEDQRTRFTLWALNMNVFGSLHCSLDYRLRYNMWLIDTIRQALKSIFDSLDSREYCTRNEGQNTFLG